MRANFFPTGTTSYFGYTYNGSSFINSSTCSDYLAVTIDSSGNWSGTMQAKIDVSSNSYAGSGNYGFKIRRYTQSCSSYIWSNETTITASYSNSTPTPTPTPTPSPGSSSSFTISNIPTELDSDKTFSVSISLSLSNSPSTKFYLKGAFKKEDSTNYFGQTKVSGDWVKNSSSYSDQYSITTDSSGNWSGNLEMKVDAFDSGYEGGGDYKFKVGRYTDSGSGPTWSNESSIKINYKEVTGSDEEIGVINLSQVSPSPESKVLSTTFKDEDLPEVVYSLENYRKISTHTAIPLATAEAKVKSEKGFNPFVILGSLIVLGSLGFSFYIYYQYRLKS